MATSTSSKNTHEEPSQTSVRKRKQRSKVWDDFEQVQNELGQSKAICKHCKQEFAASSSNGTSNLRNHSMRCRVKKAESGQQHGALTNKDDGTPTFRNSKFNQERSRRDVCKMIVKHDYPFSMVEHDYFREFVKNLQPAFQLKHRNTISSDIKKLYNEERIELYGVLGRLTSRISLTTDLWTAQNTRDAYICLTGHFIDEDWVLKKKVLNFQIMEGGHSGEDITRVVMKCLVHWNIDKKVSTITLDNASSNIVMITKLKDILNKEGLLVLDGEYFHIRCAAHVLNLIVKDGISMLGETLNKIRDSCKYVRSTPQRKLKWNAAVDQVKDQIFTKKNVSLDCPTRWNSTYEMLSTALDYKEAFVRLAAREEDFKTNPSREDWEHAKTICDCLQIFYESTNTLSGSKYPTADIYFPEVCEIHIHLLELLGSENESVLDMAKKMMEKFNKYWANCSLILAVAYVLNPECKLKFVGNYFKAIYGDSGPASWHTNQVLNAISSIYDSYAPSKPSSLITTQHSTTSSSSERISSAKVPTSNKGKRVASWYEEEGIGSVDTKSELDIYLKEPISRLNELKVLDWWKFNSPKYPTLSKMARDILAIPVTSVPSESAFSTGGRVLNEQRASLAPSMVQALICTQDWLPPLSKDSFGSCSTNEQSEVDIEEKDQEDTSLIEVIDLSTQMEYSKLQS